MPPTKSGPRALFMEPEPRHESRSQVYGEGEEVALAVALCPGEGVGAGCALFCGGGVDSSGPEAPSVFSGVL